jgi:nucleotidyltransferase substrate binding protein (TIGR01987 family)
VSKDVLQYRFIEKLKTLSFIDEIWLFGSRARGDNMERADIDLAIICPRATDLDWLKVVDIIGEADTLLKIDFLRFEKEKMSDEFYENVLKHKKILYMKELYWKDHFYALERAINRLKDVMEHHELDKNDYMRDAAIQRFEFTIELFWKVLKKVLYYEKIEATTPRDTLSKAYQYKFIDSEDIWLNMLDDRNNTSQAYKEEEAKLIFEHIKSYLPIFEKTYKSLKDKYRL